MSEVFFRDDSMSSTVSVTLAATGEALEIVELENRNQNSSEISNQNPLVSNERDDGEPGRCHDEHSQGQHH